MKDRPSDAGVILLRKIEKGHGRATWRTGGRGPLIAKLKADGLVVEIAGDLALTDNGKMVLWSIDHAADRKRSLKNGTRR